MKRILPFIIILVVLGVALTSAWYLTRTIPAAPNSPVNQPPVSPLEQLSDRELEVFQMMGQGKPTRQIAEELNLTIPTIHSFRNRIKEKLQFKNATEMMLHAIQWVRESLSR